MGEPRTRSRLPWGLLLTGAALAGVAVVAQRGLAQTDAAAPWPSVVAVVVAVVAVFLVLRWLQTILWGIVAGLFLLLHPLYLEGAANRALALRAEAIELVMLVCIVVSWRLVFRAHCTWKAWLLVGLLLCAGTALAWSILPRAGLSATAMVIGGLPVGAVLAARRRRNPLSPRPSWGNITSAMAIGLLAPAAGLSLTPRAAHLPGWSSGVDHAPENAVDAFLAAAKPDSPWLGLDDLFSGDLERWCWPTPWVILPLMAWGLWRTVRRGWKQTRRTQLPLAWVLTWFAVVTVGGVTLHSAGAGDSVLIALASLEVLLAVFCVADLVRGLTERLVLAPPEENG
jgi:hypothetical protein